jgi:CBS domain-containing protein
MTWSVVSTRPDATLGQAGLTMFQRRIGSPPVVQHGRLVGILTDTDLLRAMVLPTPDEPTRRILGGIGVWRLANQPVRDRRDARLAAARSSSSA